MRAALFLSSSDGNTYSQYAKLWAVAARAGWGIAGVLDDDCGYRPGLDELRRLLARAKSTPF